MQDVVGERVPEDDGTDLFDAAHVHHQKAHQWLTSERANGWATCPITQGACMRILSQPSYPGRLAVADVARRVWQATQANDHHFWPDAIQPCDPSRFHHPGVLTPKYLTDLYLLALAVENRGRLVTFDRGISRSAVSGAEPEHLVVI